MAAVRLLPPHLLRSSPRSPFLPPRLPRLARTFVVANASSKPSPDQVSKSSSRSVKKIDTEVNDEEDVEEDLPWIQDKAMDLVEFTGTITQAIPGPRVGGSALPLAVAVPLAYLGITFVISFVRTVRKFTSPRAQRQRMVNKNASLLTSVDELFRTKGVTHSALKRLIAETGFGMEDILRKYIRYALNEKPFDPELVALLINLRKATQLEDAQVAGVLNEVSRRIVKDKGPVIMDPSGFTEKGFKRKLAVKALFGKILYLSEIPEFCSLDSSLVVKEIFGVTDEDAEKLRIHTLSEAGAVDSLYAMADDDSPSFEDPPPQGALEDDVDSEPGES